MSRSKLLGRLLRLESDGLQFETCTSAALGPDAPEGRDGADENGFMGVVGGVEKISWSRSSPGRREGEDMGAERSTSSMPCSIYRTNATASR